MPTSNTTHTLLALASLPEEWVARLQQLDPALEIIRAPVRDGSKVTDEQWRDAEILYTYTHFLPKPQQAPRLRWVQLYSAGTNGLSEQPIYQTAVRFTTASGVHAGTIAEYVLAVTLAWYQRLPTLFRWQQQHFWPPQSGRAGLAREEISGKTIGIVGYGSIGRQVARLARGVGMRVLAMQQSQDHRDHGFILPGQGDREGSLPERYYTSDELHAMLQNSDVVVIALPLTPATHNLFDTKAFAAMKSSAFLVNIARGDICDEQALVHALHNQVIAGAALDVFHQEPLPEDHPLWHLSNVIISPHATGMHAQYNTHAAMLFEENLRRYLANEPLYNEVNKARGY